MQDNLFGFDLSPAAQNMDVLSSISGLQYHPNFISVSEEGQLLASVRSEKWLDDLQRQVQHYGFKYDYKSRSIDESQRIGPLPQWSQLIIDKMISLKIVETRPDQLIVNKYEPGQGIAMHVDCEPCFDDTIVSLSLGSDIVMNFKRAMADVAKVPLLLERRSLTVLRGEARYQYQHGIDPRKKDKFHGHQWERETRISLTFRKTVIQ
jgi:alkylated DNA repair dioxygenase AlkB